MRMKCTESIKKLAEAQATSMGANYKEIDGTPR